MTDLRWMFFSLTLRDGASFEKRQESLIERFRNADTWIRKVRGKDYRHQFSNVELDDPAYPACVFGYLLRSPMVARGRSVDSRRRTSRPEQQFIDELYDWTEFIYDLKSSVLAVHVRSPFTSPRNLALIFSSLCGMMYPLRPGELDVVVQVLKESDKVRTALATDEPLTEVTLKYLKPNPESGDDDLTKLGRDLGAIAEDTNADVILFKAGTLNQGSLDKSEEGFISRSIRLLLEKGYLKRGRLEFVDRVVDVLQAREKIRMTPGYSKDEQNQDKGLRAWVMEWWKALKHNRDIYGK